MIPWIARNAIVFGRFIPVKSNLPFEFYQSNVLEPSGVLRDEQGTRTPFELPGWNGLATQSSERWPTSMSTGPEAAEEIRRDPLAYLIRVRNRLLAATCVYYSFENNEGRRRVLVRSLLHPLPFLGLLAMVLSGRRPARPSPPHCPRRVRCLPHALCAGGVLQA